MNNPTTSTGRRRRRRKSTEKLADAKSSAGVALPISSNHADIAVTSFSPTLVAKSAFENSRDMNVVDTSAVIVVNSTLNDIESGLGRSVTPPTPSTSDGIHSWSGLFSAISTPSKTWDKEANNNYNMVERLKKISIHEAEGGDNDKNIFKKDDFNTNSNNNIINDDYIQSLPKIALTWKSLQPVRHTRSRGLTNYGNMCFLNSILQSLIHCSPLGNMFDKLKDRLEFISLRKAPFLRSMGEIFSAYEETEGGGGGDCQTSFSTKGGLGSTSSLVFTPELLYNCIRDVAGTGSFQGGVQEDAQEFLTFLLDQLHEEMLTCRNLLGWNLFTSNMEDLSFDHSSNKGDNNNSNNNNTNNGGEWLEMGRKQKISVARVMEHTQSPISFLFFGRFRSVVQRPRAKDSVTSEPFHCINLNIENEAINDLIDALKMMTLPESIDKQITKSVIIESAPPILIIQLNRFVYNHKMRTVEKAKKFISYPEKLILTKEMSYLGNSTLAYKLFSVIYHHGRNANGGHYTAHVRQQAFKERKNHNNHNHEDDDQWMLYDDTSLTIDPLEKVLSPPKNTNQTAYLFFYIKT